MASSAAGEVESAARQAPGIWLLIRLSTAPTEWRSKLAASASLLPERNPVSSTFPRSPIATNGTAACGELPAAHILQTWDWGEFKRQTVGWQPTRLAFERDGIPVALASVGMRSIGPFKVLYVSKGPVLDYGNEPVFLEVLDTRWNPARGAMGAVWLKIDPDVVVATGIPGEVQRKRPGALGQRIRARLKDRGWRYSDAQVQFRNTIKFDLSRTEDELLMRDERQYAAQDPRGRKEGRDRSRRRRLMISRFCTGSIASRPRATAF